MPTLGSTAEPTDGQAWFGVNSKNHHAIKVTMPSGGPWLVTRLGCWLSGQSETADVKLVVWALDGTILGQTAQHTAASRAFAVGNNEKVELDLVTPVEIAGGTQIFIGFARDPADQTQFGTRNGVYRRDKYSASWPSTMTGYDQVANGGIGSYLIYETANTAPNAPTNLQPTGNEVRHSGTAPILSGTRSDPDSGDYITAYEIEVYADDGTTKVYDSGKINVGGSPTTFARTVSLPSAHAFYRWKARTWDKEGVAGPFSALQRFYANAVPATPNQASLSSSTTLTPTFGGNFNDPGDTLATVKIVVYRDSDGAVMWDSGEIPKSGTAWTHAYGGSALSYGVTYKMLYYVTDSHGAQSDSSSFRTWTPTLAVGPDNLSPTGENPRQGSLTPTLTIGHSADFQNDEVQVYTSTSLGTPISELWYKTWEGSDYADTQTKDRVYAGTALVYGNRYVWRARVELADGSISEWSDWKVIRINATPSAPTGMTPTGGTVTSDQTPELHMDFADADVEAGDIADLVDIEVRDNADDSLDWSATGATPSGDLEHVVSVGATLDYEKTYKWRARFTDSFGLQGPWSSYQLFKVSEPPTATLISPADASEVTESTPDLDWGYSSPASKAQYSYRVRIFDVGPIGNNYADEVLAYDSGVRISADTAHTVPFGYLVNDHDYRWEVTVTDTDGLTHTLT